MVYDLKPEEIEKFISSDVIELMGLSNLPEDKKQEMREKIISTIENRALARIMGMIKDRNKLEELEELEGEEAMAKFFTENNIPYEDIFAEEAITYKAQLKNAADMADVGFQPKVAGANKEG